MHVLKATFLSLGSGSVDPDICADQDLDPLSQNVADPTDPDPEHWLENKDLF